MPFLLSQLIEAARWLGALIVLAHHVTNMFVSQADIFSAPHAPPVYVWWFFTPFSLAHQAVVGFFVISGWLVGGAVLAHIRKGRLFMREYFIHRVTRIYLVLVPAVALTAALDQFGRVAFAASGAYDGPAFKGHFDWAYLGGTLLSLQGIWFRYFGTNGLLWSLACEFWYYVTFPLLLAPFARQYPAAMRWGGFALGAAIFLFLSTPQSWFGIGYVLWAVGAFGTFAPRPLITSRWLALAIYAAAVVAIRLLVRGPLLEAHPGLFQVTDLLAAASFVNVLLAFRDGPHEGFSLLQRKFHKPLADFSFSLYSIHMPLVVLALGAVGAAMGGGWAKELATPTHYGVAMGVMAATIAAAYGFSRLTEANTGAVRRALRARLDRIRSDGGHAGEVTSDISQPR